MAVRTSVPLGLRWRWEQEAEGSLSSYVNAPSLSSYGSELRKVGIAIAARNLDSAAPFQASDILNLQPVVKHSVPTCTDERKLMEAGKSGWPRYIENTIQLS